MKVYIVCRHWCEGYEDHGWDIMGTYATKNLAENKMSKMVEDRREDPDDWWVDELEVESDPIQDLVDLTQELGLYEGGKDDHYK